MCANLGNEPGHLDEKPNHNDKHSGIYPELDFGTNLGADLGIEPDF